MNRFLAMAAVAGALSAIITASSGFASPSFAASAHDCKYYGRCAPYAQRYEGNYAGNLPPAEAPGAAPQGGVPQETGIVSPHAHGWEY